MSRYVVGIIAGVIMLVCACVGSLLFVSSLNHRSADSNSYADPSARSAQLVPAQPIVEPTHSPLPGLVGSALREDPCVYAASIAHVQVEGQPLKDYCQQLKLTLQKQPTLYVKVSYLVDEYCRYAEKAPYVAVLLDDVYAHLYGYPYGYVFSDEADRSSSSLAPKAPAEGPAIARYSNGIPTLVPLAQIRCQIVETVAPPAG